MTPEQKAVDYAKSIEVDYHKEKFNLVINAYYAGYTQCQEDMAEDIKIIDLFISEINKEFPNENWEYLEFIKDRLINSLNKQD